MTKPPDAALAGEFLGLARAEGDLAAGSAGSGGQALGEDAAFLAGRLVRLALEDRLKRSNALLGDAITAEHEYGPRVSAAVDDTHDAMGDLQKATLEHVFAMRAILRPDQQARFDAVVSKSLAAQPQ